MTSTTRSFRQDSGFFMLPDLAVETGCCDLMAFAAPAVQVDFSGTRVIDTPQPNGGMVHQEFTHAPQDLSGRRYGLLTRASAGRGSI